MEERVERGERLEWGPWGGLWGADAGVVGERVCDREGGERGEDDAAELREGRRRLHWGRCDEVDVWRRGRGGGDAVGDAQGAERGEADRPRVRGCVRILAGGGVGPEEEGAAVGRYTLKEGTVRVGVDVEVEGLECGELDEEEQHPEAGGRCGVQGERDQVVQLDPDSPGNVEGAGGDPAGW